MHKKVCAFRCSLRLRVNPFLYETIHAKAPSRKENPQIQNTTKTFRGLRRRSDVTTNGCEARNSAVAR